MPRVICPHCLETVHMDESLDGSAMRCPVCARDPGAAGHEEGVPSEYQLHGQKEKAHQTKEVQEYVRSLEDMARKELARQPYHRGRFPIDLWAGLILITCGVGLCLFALLRFEGFMSTLINGIFLPSLFVLVGAVCLIFRTR